jgi:glycine/D-amino acid oxidase-like deaminating enzyme
VVVLEQQQLTSGTTWHAAGLIETFGSLSDTATGFRKYTRDLYKTLEAETGLSTGWKEVGFIELASNRDYLEQFRRISAFNRRHGVDVHEIGPDQIKKLFPLCKVHVSDESRIATSSSKSLYQSHSLYYTSNQYSCSVPLFFKNNVEILVLNPCFIDLHR